MAAYSTVSVSEALADREGGWEGETEEERRGVGVGAGAGAIPGVRARYLKSGQRLNLPMCFKYASFWSLSTHPSLLCLSFDPSSTPPFPTTVLFELLIQLSNPFSLAAISVSYGGGPRLPLKKRGKVVDRTKRTFICHSKTLFSQRQMLPFCSDKEASSS